MKKLFSLPLLLLIVFSSALFSATPINAASKIKGRLGISQNKHYFVDGKGKPFFWLGSTQWTIFRGYTTPEAQIILKNIASKGFSVVGTMIVGPGDGTIPNKEGERPWLNNDPSTPNEAYFKNIDAVVRIAAENGLYIRLGILHNAQLKYMSDGRGKAYAKWVAHRYKNEPNVFYSIHGDVKNPVYIEMVRQMAAAIEEEAGKDILISQKPDPSPNTSGDINDEPWLDYTQSQTYKWINLIYPFVTRDYNRIPTRPNVMDEGAYEHGSEYGFEVTPLLIRRQAYYTYLAGGHHTYGHNDHWRALPTWEKALEAPGAIQLGILKRTFMKRSEWWKLVPDQGLLKNGGKTEGAVLQLAARHENGRWAVFYIAEPASFSVIPDKLGAAKMNAFWIDPRNGNRLKIGRLSARGEKLFTVPDGWEDAVLVLEK